ncbi:MAG: DUF4304 domain-containing protein [Clostridia bacterium]|nr:DUF4304 domain-containing protein [Clostridia bacterium]
MYFEKDKQLDTKSIVDEIEKAVYAEVKPLGFKKHGCTLHRFVDGDISQVINFQIGCPSKSVYDVLWVHIGIRVPECELRSFEPEENVKKYYPESWCNIRSCLKEMEGQKEDYYDLHDSVQEITSDILRQIRAYIIPAFNALNSRAAVLENRRSYPRLDAFNNRLILLEEAMIWGRLGDLEKAESTFNEYYESKAQEYKGHEGWRSYGYLRAHLNYLNELADRLDIKINHPI